MGPRVGNTFSRVPDPEATRGAHFSGDETDKDFQFVAGDGSSGDKTLKYDPKNFSFKLKNRDSVVVEAREGRCSWRHTCCNSLYLALATITLVLIVTLLSTSPQNYRCLIHSTQLTKTMAVKDTCQGKSAVFPSTSCGWL